jgi:hypothetical protein
MRAILRRIAPAGLRWRLAGWFTLVTLLCIAIVFVAVYRGTGTQLRSQIDKELGGDAAELAHNLEVAHARTPDQVSTAAPLYIGDQPFSASSTLPPAPIGRSCSATRIRTMARRRPSRRRRTASPRSS